MTIDDFFETNRRNWEDRVPIHLRDTTGAYGIDAFLAAFSGHYKEIHRGYQIMIAKL